MKNLIAICFGVLMDGAEVLYIRFGAGEPVKFIRCGD